jgi:hypothetical protein
MDSTNNGSLRSAIIVCTHIARDRTKDLQWQRQGQLLAVPLQQMIVAQQNTVLAFELTLDVYRQDRILADSTNRCIWLLPDSHPSRNKQQRQTRQLKQPYWQFLLISDPHRSMDSLSRQTPD